MPTHTHAERERDGGREFVLPQNFTIVNIMKKTYHKENSVVFLMTGFYCIQLYLSINYIFAFTLGCITVSLFLGSWLDKPLFYVSMNKIYMQKGRNWGAGA